MKKKKGKQTRRKAKPPDLDDICIECREGPKSESEWADVNGLAVLYNADPDELGFRDIIPGSYKEEQEGRGRKRVFAVWKQTCTCCGKVEQRRALRENVGGFNYELPTVS